MITKQLLDLVSQLEATPAPKQTTRYGEHVELLCEIDKDNTATITMTKEAYDALLAQAESEQ